MLKGAFLRIRAPSLRNAHFKEEVTLSVKKATFAKVAFHHKGEHSFKIGGNLCDEWLYLRRGALFAKESTL